MIQENKFLIHFSQRRKNKGQDSVGLTAVISSRRAAKDLVKSLAPPQSYDDGDADTDDDNRPPATTPRRSNKAPKSPQPRRKSLVGNPNLPHAPGQLPGQKIGKKRSSLAPVHKQNAKMDLARAMGIMGFNSSRWLECSQVSLRISIKEFITSWDEITIFW